jgi:uncharacterized membrane protein
MSSNVVLAISPSLSQAELIVTDLKAAGIPERDISVLFPDQSGTRDFAHENNTKAPEGATAGAVSGGAVGGVLGLLAGIGALAIPGVGPLIAAGPILAALSGLAVGATVGGITGALVGLGIPEVEAKVYEGKVKNGNILIAVHTDDSTQTKRVREIYEAAGAEDVKVASTKKAPTADRNDETVTRR